LVGEVLLSLAGLEMEEGFRRTRDRARRWLAAMEPPPPGSKGIWLHMCSGVGSALHEAVVSRGCEVVAVDDLVLLPQQIGVTRVTMDLGEMSWELWQLEAVSRAGRKMTQKLGVYTGVPCDTFCHADASNKRQGKDYNYRLHTDEARPPQHAEGTAKGDLARTDDWIAEGTARTSLGAATPWVIENPEAYLRCRPFMGCLKGFMRTVHYCAYWSMEEAIAGPACMKPTNIWTNAGMWTSKGTTGMGKCGGGKCGWLLKKGNKRSHPQLEGAPRALKMRTPRALLDEILDALEAQRAAQKKATVRRRVGGAVADK
jgi:hypothetical protein